VGLLDLKHRILAIGDSYMNLQMSVPGVGASSETIYGIDYGFHPSGNSAITALTAGKHGADCIFCTMLGDDNNGERLYNYYKSCNLDVSYIKKHHKYQTGLEFSAYDELNSNSYIVKGANAAFSKADIDNAFGAFPDLLVVPQDYMPINSEEQLYSNPSDRNSEIDKQIGEVPSNYREITVPQTSRPDSLALYAINKAMERGIEMVVEYTETTTMLPLDKVVGIKILVISDEMLKKVTGTAPISIEKTLSALISFSSKIKAKYYVVQKGNDTTFVYDGMYFEIPQAPAVIKSLSHQRYPMMHKTYTGALIAEYLETKNIVRACKYAQIVSLMTRAPQGAFQRVPNRNEVMKFLSDNSIDLDKI